VSQAEGPRDVEPVTLDELVQLMAEELSGNEERALRARMARDPNAEMLLRRLRDVDAVVAGDDATPSKDHERADMPEDVRVRLQAHLARLAGRRHGPTASPSDGAPPRT
jgi:hypothetical protein